VVGEGVTSVEPGDFVILKTGARCARLPGLPPRPPGTASTPQRSQPMTLEDGTPLSAALGIGRFVEKTAGARRQCTKVDPRVSPDVAAC